LTNKDVVQLSIEVTLICTCNAYMCSITPTEIRDYLAGLALANEFEIQELRQASVETKLRQLWVLMGAAALFEDESQRETEVHDVRQRWARLYRAHCA
jgi:hypothetical protein